MVVGTILKALRVEAARLAAAGTDRLSLCARKAKRDVWISPRFEQAILAELRVKAAIALLQGAGKVELSDTLDGQEFRGLVIHVDPEQYGDVRTERPIFHDLTVASERATTPAGKIFGTFA